MVYLYIDYIFSLYVASITCHTDKDYLKNAYDGSFLAKGKFQYSPWLRTRQDVRALMGDKFSPSKDDIGAQPVNEARSVQEGQKRGVQDTAILTLTLTMS